MFSDRKTLRLKKEQQQQTPIVSPGSEATSLFARGQAFGFPGCRPRTALLNRPGGALVLSGICGLQWLPTALGTGRESRTFPAAEPGAGGLQAARRLRMTGWWRPSRAAPSPAGSGVRRVPGAREARATAAPAKWPWAPTRAPRARAWAWGGAAGWPPSPTTGARAPRPARWPSPTPRGWGAGPRGLHPPRATRVRVAENSAHHPDGRHAADGAQVRGR